MKNEGTARSDGLLFLGFIVFIFCGMGAIGVGIMAWGDFKFGLVWTAVLGFITAAVLLMWVRDIAHAPSDGTEQGESHDHKAESGPLDAD